MSDRLSALRLFVRVARAGNFSRAARELGLSQPSASRIIGMLEKEVGAALFTRSTRALALTEAGAEYLARVEPALAALDDADHAARGTGELRGTVRIATSSSFSVRALIPILPDFLKQHPQLKVDLLVSDQRQALISDGVDVAFRWGSLPDSSATARLLGRVPRVLVASPAYLRRSNRLMVPADLSLHELIIGPTGLVLDSWNFEKAGRQVSLRLEGRVKVSANESSVAAAVAGLGITCTALVGCSTELASGVLVRVLPDWDMGSVEIHAVFPGGRATKAAARALADHMLKAFRE